VCNARLSIRKNCHSLTVHICHFEKEPARPAWIKNPRQHRRHRTARSKYFEHRLSLMRRGRPRAARLPASQAASRAAITTRLHCRRPRETY
jgi:hypothetical protein